jgi:hypothetical protein
MFFVRFCLFVLFFWQHLPVFAKQTTGNYLSAKSALCSNQEKYFNQILQQVELKNPNAISDLPVCFSQNRNLIFQVAIIDPVYFQDASDILRQDKIFIQRLIKIKPEVLKYAAPEVRGNAVFIAESALLSRNVLKFATWKLLDNQEFIAKMIDLDADNYQYASDRVRAIESIAIDAFTDNGLLLEFATNNLKSNFDIVKVAVSNSKTAIKFASENLQKNQDLLKIVSSNQQNLQQLDNFLLTNYLINNEQYKKMQYFHNKGKFFGKNQLIDHNFVSKWHINLAYDKQEVGVLKENWQLIPVYHRNYEQSWREDFKFQPDLIQKIDGFFAKRKINKKIIDNLKTTFLWKVKNKPETFVFNLYNLTEVSEAILGSQFANITSLTAIAQKTDKKWVLSVIEVIFAKDMQLSTNFTLGHKKYTVLDLFTDNKVSEKNPETMVIFKVEDELNEYLQVYFQQENGKYRLLHQTKAYPEFFNN